jgi:peptidoglycan/LPS O-acetylase OafA/YrhL
MPDSPPQATPHLVRIDVLRAVAILLVFCHHYWVAVRQMPETHWDAVPWDRMLLVPWELGYLGVKLFFVISGFCIHFSFLNWRRRRDAAAPFWRPFLTEFFWRRFWRIYPPYLGALLLFYWLHYQQPLSLRALRHLGVHALLLNNLSPAFFLNINPSFWSIAVEWQLYLVYPLFLWIALAWRIEAAFLLAALVACALQFGAPHFTSSYALLRSPFAYWLEWVIGAWLAEYFATRRRVFRAHAWLAPATGLAAVAAHAFSDSAALQYFLPTLFFAVLIEWRLLAHGPLGRLERALIPVGLCSYSLYLFHQPYLGAVVHAASAWLRTAPHLVIWLAIPAALFVPLGAFCWGYYRWVECGSIATGKRLWR